MNKAAQHQIDPTPNNHPCIQDLVIKDIQDRKKVGIERYGTVLQPFNGRSALMDAYQEALDLAVYLKQLLYEETEKKLEVTAIIEAARRRVLDREASND